MHLITDAKVISSRKTGCVDDTRDATDQQPARCYNGLQLVYWLQCDFVESARMNVEMFSKWTVLRQ